MHATPIITLPGNFSMPLLYYHIDMLMLAADRKLEASAENGHMVSRFSERIQPATLIACHIMRLFH